MSRIVIGGLLGVAVGVGFLGFAVYDHLDGLPLVERGVDAAATDVRQRYRGGTWVTYRSATGASRLCVVEELPPIASVVYDPEHPSRCRVPEAVGAWSRRELFRAIAGAILILASVLPIGIQALLRAAEDPLDRMV